MDLVWLCMLAALGSGNAARILGIFQYPSISHQLPFQAVMKALAARGHQVTVISTDPLKIPHANYTDIDLSFSYTLVSDEKNDMQQTMGKHSPYTMMTLVAQMLVGLCHAQLSSQVIQNFIKSEQKFDLVFIGNMRYSCMSGIIHKVGSPPKISILSLGGTAHSYQSMGSPFNPAVDPEMLLHYDDHMDFWQRTNNFLYWLWTNLYMTNSFGWQMEKVSRQYFGEKIPTVWESERNYSLLMINNHWSMSYPIPLVPSIIELGSLHLQAENKPLPKDLKAFLDSATEGFVYFSLGSNTRSDKLPETKRNAFLAAFAELPQKVLWKWESDTLPGQPKNVMLGKWLPQQDVLAHPNCRLFVTQGGLQSLNEATHNAVPLVGIPFVGDQAYNVKKIENVGAGLKIDIDTATKDIILQTLRTVINDPSYRENMRQLSATNKDQQETPMERAIWWTEYVLRHNGAKHLRCAALDLSWIQYLLLDVIVFLLASLLTLSLICYLLIRNIFRCVRNMTYSKTKKE